jgi:hypothetical protein
MKTFMKTTKALFGVLTTTLALAGQAQAQSFLTNGLVAYYPFDGNANDASGNTNNLVNYGATLCADRFGNTNQAYYFNGSSYLCSSVSPLSQIDDWTMSAWIRPGSLSQATGYAVCVGYDTGSAGDGFAFGVSGGQGKGQGGSGQPGNDLWVFFPGQSFISDAYVFSSTNQWEQIVMMRDSGTLMFYVSGVFTTNDQPTFSSGYAPIEPTSFEVGSGSSSDRFFTGAVDDVRIYDRALSSNEVEQLYQYESTPLCTLPDPATATATVASGFVVSATVTDSGCGYTSVPLVQILGGGGTGATATAIVTNGVVVGITITDAGTGYTGTPTVLISSPSPCIPYPATAIATVTNGFVIGATVTDGGCGYTNTPAIQIVGGGGEGATATAIVTNGVVVGITITDAGSGYTSPPAVYIYSPLGVQIGILQAVIPTFSSLSIGSNYQLQASLDLSTWTNEGSVFTATNSTMIYPQYFNVAGWNQLYFRLQAAP